MRAAIIQLNAGGEEKQEQKKEYDTHHHLIHIRPSRFL